MSGSTSSSTMAAERTEFVGLRADEDPNVILRELLKGADNAMQVDCAGPRVSFMALGFFVFPRGSLSPPIEVKSAA